MYVLSTPFTYIGITVLSYFELPLTPSTYIVFDDIVGKSQLSKTFLGLKIS